MNWETLLVGLFVWLGGVFTWLIAATFEFAKDHSDFKERREYYRGGAEHDEEFAQSIHDLDEFVENRGVPRASSLRSLMRTGVQPLLVLSFLLVLSSRPWIANAYVLLDIGVLAIAVLVCTTVLHELYGKDKWWDRWWYRAIILMLWIGYAGLLVWA